MPTYLSPHRAVRRFSRTSKSWFPAIHRKTFGGPSNEGAIDAAVRRMMNRP